MTLLRRSAVPLLAAAVLTACGSTVPTAVQQSSGVDGPITSSGPTSLTGTSPTTQQSVGPAGSSEIGTTGSLPTGTTGGSPVSTHGATGSRPPTPVKKVIAAAGPGWDATYAYIGYTNLSDFSAATKAAGTTSVDPGDGRGEVAALVKYVNAHGGLLGRKLKAVEFDNKTTTAYGNPSSSSQSACSAFTEDHHVLAVINFVSAYETDVFHQCLAKAKVLELIGSTSPSTVKSLGQYAPYIYSDLVPVEDRIVPTLVDRSSRAGSSPRGTPARQRPRRRRRSRWR